MLTEVDIQRAIQEATNGLALVSAGEYEISSPIEIPGDNFSLVGPQATLFPGKKFPDDEPLIRVSGRSRNSRRNWVKIDGLRIEGSGRRVVGIYSNHTFRLSLVWLRINSIKGAGLAIGNAQDLRVKECDIRNSGNESASQASLMLFADQAPVEGLPPNHPGANTINIESCTIERYEGTAFSASDQTVMRVRDCKFHGQNEDRSASKVGVSLVRCDRVLLSGCHTVLSKEADYRSVRCREVKIENPFTSQGRKIRVYSDGGVHY